MVTQIGEVGNECTSHNVSPFDIFLPKIIKIGGNLTKFWQKQFCIVFLRHGVYYSVCQHWHCEIVLSSMSALSGNVSKLPGYSHAALESKIQYSITSVGHGPRSWSRFLGSQLAVDISHKPGGRLPLLSTRPAVTFPTKEIIPLPIGQYQIILFGDRGVSKV